MAVATSYNSSCPKNTFPKWFSKKPVLCKLNSVSKNKKLANHTMVMGNISNSLKSIFAVFRHATNGLKLPNCEGRRAIFRPKPNALYPYDMRHPVLHFC
jgi:hypothetical protein